jgi:carbamoyltransferase
VIEPVDVSPFPHSLGLVYSAFTSFLGFKVNDGECSTMALAAFGQPRFVDQVRRILRVGEDGAHEVEEGWFDLTSDHDVPVTRKFISVFGEPRRSRDKYTFDNLRDAPSSADDEERRFADVACSVQQVLEEAVLAYARRARRLTGLPCLAYGGGVALNCVANGKLVRSGIFEDVYIPPDPGDGGGAAGAALYLSSLKNSVPAPARDFHPYGGASIAAEELEELAPYLSPEVWSRFSLMQPRAVRKEDLRTYGFNGEQEMLEWTADRIHEGKIVGWCQGRFENGPRALGNRSILIRPDDVTLARRLSGRVKRRAPFRPYAASLTEEEARRSLEAEGLERKTTSRWMQSSFRVKDGAKAALRAAIHVDGTTRPNCVLREENPLYHSLLVAIGRRSGREAVLNTSLNEAGYPLVASVADALMLFSRTDLDILIVGHYALEKAWKS